MFRNAMCSTAIVTSLSVSAAFADVTPEEAWESWQAMATSAGQEMTVGTETRNGDTLLVTDLVVTYKDPMGGSFSSSFDTLSFKDNGDGTVTVQMPDSFPMNLAFPPDVGGTNPGSLKLTVSQQGMSLVVSGSATETAYAFTAPVSRITLDEVTDSGGAVQDVDAEIVMAEATGNYTVSRTGEQTLLDYDYAIKSMSVTVEGQDANAGAGGKMTLSMVDLAVTMKGNLLSPDVMANMAAALNSGFTMDMGFDFGAMSFAVDITDPTGQTRFTLDSTGGGLDLAMNKAQLAYGVSLGKTQIVASGPEIPFPEVQVGLGEFGFKVDMPLLKSDAPQAFAYLTKVVDLTSSEDIWGLFDPAGVLSREPATFVVDIKGTGRLKQDIVDPGLYLGTPDLPAELDTLDLTLLQAKAAGADVSATGGLTFDNSDTVTYGGAPKPAGKVTVSIKGVQALIDNLIAMGILTDDDAMGFRMVLAMYARPGAAADELVTELEFKDGGFFANGQQVW